MKSADENQTQNNNPEQWPITAKEFRFATIIAITHCILSLPAAYFALASAVEPQNQQFQSLSLFLGAISTMLWIYLIVKLKKLLNIRFQYRHVDNIISALIFLSLLLCGLSFATAGDPDDQRQFLGNVMIALLVPIGVCAIMLGRRLMEVAIPYNGLKLFAWTSFAVGVCMASIIFLLLALPLDFLSSIALIIIFYTAHSEIKAFENR